MQECRQQCSNLLLCFQLAEEVCDCLGWWLFCQQKLSVQMNMLCMVLHCLKWTIPSGAHCFRRSLGLHKLLHNEEAHPSSISDRLLEEDRSHPCPKWCNFREVFVVLPGFTLQIDDLIETGYMNTVGHHSFQNLLVCLQAVGGIICDHCSGIFQVQIVAVEGG